VIDDDACAWLRRASGVRTTNGSEAGSYLRIIDFVYHSTLGLRVIEKKRNHQPSRKDQIDKYQT